MIISLIGYCFVFSGLFLFVDVLNINQSLAFMIIYGLSYMLLYFLQLKVLFQTQHTKGKLIKFLLSIFVFYVLANLLFNIGVYLNLNYLIATVLTIGLLFPIRFMVSKFIIFKA
ncbi:GtrA family protein [Winogradskyella poriferorum]|uniref:GtrA family protein n=1 Tax=Winogradskyella poriferorum TaxID=307627 RepID=UPI003D659EF7